jgi:predicted Rossmann fold flavoprotein
MMFDVIIVGGGASGLLCAITAAQRGRRVLVLDSSNKVGKKILMSGGGRCNFTNLNIEPDCFLSENTHFCKSALSRYTQWDFIALVEKHKIAYEERDHGQLFCKGSAKEILAMLLNECEQAKVEIRKDCEISSVEILENSDENNARFKVKSSLGKFKSESLVIASGGLSIPKMGATNFAYKIAQQFNLPVITTRAGLVPFTFSDQYKAIFERLSGVSHEVILSTAKKQFHLNILFTHRGLSGPAALQLSSYWQVGESIFINLFPNRDIKTLFSKTKKENPKLLLRNVLSQYLPKKLVQELEVLFWSEWKDKVIAEIPDKVLTEISEKLIQWELKPSGTEGYRTAEVTLGGVDTDSLSSKTMECKKQKGLYFIGEAVDVTGHLGGYNFQWAWSSGYVAGQVI